MQVWINILHLKHMTKCKYKGLIGRGGQINPNIAIFNTRVGIGIGSIHLQWDRYSSFSSSPTFSSCAPFHQITNTLQCKRRSSLVLHCTLCSTPCCALLSTCHMTQRSQEQQSETHALLMTDAIIDHGRDKAECSLELFSTLCTLSA